MGAQAYSWLLDTVIFELEREHRVSISEINKTKLGACLSMHHAEQFWESWQVFEKTVHGLLGTPSTLDYVHPPTLPELYAGVAASKRIRTSEWSEEVSRYAAGVFLFHEVPYAPEPLDFCQLYLAQPRYECQDCGNQGSAHVPWDGLCDVCCGRYSKGNLSLDPDPKREGKGRNIKVFFQHDPVPVKRRFDELDRHEGNVTHLLQETPEDYQAAKLIEAKDLERLWEKRFEEQAQAYQGWLT